MTTKTRRTFTDEFKREAVALLAGSGRPLTQVATELGYADQSHMIAEFRELSSLTPDTLASHRWFHPFILDARSRRTRASAESVIR